MNAFCPENSYHFQYPLYFTIVSRADAAQVLIWLTLFWLCILPQTQVVLRAESALVAKMVNLHSGHFTPEIQINFTRDRLISQDTSTIIQSQALFCSDLTSLLLKHPGSLGGLPVVTCRDPCGFCSFKLKVFTASFFWTPFNFLPSSFFEAHFSSCFSSLTC